MKIISVIPLTKGVLKEDLTYFTSLEIPAGNIVAVPVRNKKVLALVTESKNLDANKSEVKGMNFNLRKVSQDKGPSIFIPEFLESVYEASKYFAQNKNVGLASMIPAVFVEEYDKISKHKSIDAPAKKSILEKIQNLKTEKTLLQVPFVERISQYKTLVRESFARGKSIFLVSPTEFDIGIFTTELGKGIEQFTFSLHSSIPAKKILEIYEKIVTSPHPLLIIGTAPYLSIPRRDIGTIILEHENSSAYRMIKRPYIDYRVFVEILAPKMKARLIIADEMLRFETVGRKDADNLNPLYPLSFRIDFPGIIEILGRGEQEKGRKFEILKEESLEKIKSELRHKRSVFIFTLRKGLATMTVCKDCGEIIACEKCGHPLVLHLSHQGKERMFVCNKCERDYGSDKVCPSCGSWNLLPLGVGTDTVEEYVKEIMYSESEFPKTKIFKLDKESAGTASAAKKIIKEFEETPGSILIGTEMAFFYMNKKVELSVLASFDSLWNIPNFKMSEKVIQILLSLTKNTESRIIIQTKNDTDGALLAIKSGNLLSYVREELEDRKKLEYPPYKRFIKVTYFGDKEQTLKARALLEETFKDHTPEIFSGFIARLKGKYVTNMLIKVDTKKWSLPQLSPGSSIEENLLQKLYSLSPAFQIRVDPEDLL